VVGNTLKITPYGKIELDPSALVLHYALECFEGLKAYKDAKGNIRLFRPMENMNRMNNSAARLCMPTFEPKEFLSCIERLLKIDQDWIPTEKGYSLYIRPTMIATEAMLGVHSPNSAKLFCIMSPVGPYYKTGFKPVALYADTQNVRAWPGGTGGFKIGANYAPGILPALEVSKKGYQQILWLNGENISEVGTMNLFCFWTNKQGKKELVTASLDGTILPGITRKSILELAAQWKEFEIAERTWTMTELLTALKENRVIEMFGSGTAAVVSPVYKLHYKGTDYSIPCKDNVAGDLTQRFMHTITGIQCGEIEHPWSVLVK